MTPVSVHHVADGPADAPVLVLGSSVGTTGAMWEPQVRALSQRFRLVRYDHRGHGGSPVPPGPYTLEDLGLDLLALLDTLGVSRAHLGGLSMGGMVAMWLAAHAPERVDRLVVCASSPRFPDPSVWDERIDEIEKAGSVAAIADATVARWLTPGFADAHPAVRDRLYAMLVAVDPDGYAACCRAIQRMDLRPALSSITAPTLVIAGAEDPSTPPPQHAEVIAATVPGARYEVLSPAAHLLNVELAERTTELILDHLEAA